MNLPTELADYAHDAWSRWMKYLFSKSTKNPDGSVTIPKFAVDRWERQMNTPFKELPFMEQSSDYDEAKAIIRIINDEECR